METLTRTVERVSIKDDVHEFLTTRRAKVTPSRPASRPSAANAASQDCAVRRSPCSLASAPTTTSASSAATSLVSPNKSSTRFAQALQLDDAERSHLFDLARASTGPVRGSRRAAVSKVRPGVLRILESIDTPAYVRNARTDILAANDLAFVLYDGILDRDQLPLNLSRFLFLDHRAPDFFLDWATVADDAVAALRGEAGRSPHDRNLIDLVGELATKSEEFRTRWARHNVKHHRTAAKRLHNSLVGDIELTGEAMELQGDGLVIITYAVEPDSPAAEALQFLSSWASQHTGVRARRQSTP